MVGYPEGNPLDPIVSELPVIQELCSHRQRDWVRID
jgi:hypothetical protein